MTFDTFATIKECNSCEVFERQQQAQPLHGRFITYEMTRQKFYASFRGNVIFEDGILRLISGLREKTRKVTEDSTKNASQKKKYRDPYGILLSSEELFRQVNE